MKRNNINKISLHLLNLIQNQFFSSYSQLNTSITYLPHNPPLRGGLSKIEIIKEVDKDNKSKEKKYKWEVPTLIENKIINLTLTLLTQRASKVRDNNKKTHEYHLVENSPWPIYISISIFSIILSIILIFNNININNEYKYKIFIFISLLGFIICLYHWLKEIHIEGTFEGYHTEKVQKGLTTGFILFVISEICIFITLFFAFFYNSLIPSIEISSIYPPIGIESINPKTLPLLNTIILFISGITSTCSLNFLIYTNNSLSTSLPVFQTLSLESNRIIGVGKYIIGNSLIYLSLTILLGCFFSFFQYFEYFNASFSLSDSIFGSNFYTLTGFHGIHVLMGILFLFVALIRLILNHFNTDNYLNLIFANIYWHFVDYVWIILFLFLYCWAN